MKTTARKFSGLRVVMENWRRWQANRQQSPLDRALVEAVHHHDEEAVLKWLQLGANANATDKTGEPILLYAAGHCSDGIVRLLLNAGADIHAVTQQGDTVLMKAGRHCKQQEKYLLLLESGADVNAHNRQGQTALMCADEPDYIAMLLGYDADRNARDLLGHTAFMIRKAAAGSPPQRRDAVPLNHRGLAYLLRTKPQKILAWKFAEAASAGNVERLTLLLAQGADINSLDYRGDTALYRATKKIQVEAVQFLLEHGADPNATGFDAVSNGSLARWTPLMGATGLYFEEEQAPDYLRMLRLLLEHGARTEDIDALTDMSVTPLMRAADRVWLPEALLLLLEFGADVHARDCWGNTALTCASAQHIPLLLAAGAELNGQNQEGYSTLMYAASDAETEAVETLLEQGADIYLKNQEGMTALGLAQQARKNARTQPRDKDFDNRIGIVLTLLKQAGAQE